MTKSDKIKIRQQFEDYERWKWQRLVPAMLNHKKRRMSGLIDYLVGNKKPDPTIGQTGLETSKGN
jgi:hypothetical protein